MEARGSGDDHEIHEELEAALRVNNLRKLILYEPPVQTGRHQLNIGIELAELKELLAHGMNEEALIYFLRDISGLSSEKVDAARSLPIWQKMVASAPTLPRELQAIATYEFDPARFASMTTPTVLLTGSESIPPYQAAIEAVHDSLPNSEITTFDGHDHVAMLTATDRFTTNVLEFIFE